MAAAVPDLSQATEDTQFHFIGQEPFRYDGPGGDRWSRLARRWNPEDGNEKDKVLKDKYVDTYVIVDQSEGSTNISRECTTCMARVSDHAPLSTASGQRMPQFSNFFNHLKDNHPTLLTAADQIKHGLKPKICKGGQTPTSASASMSGGGAGSGSIFFAGSNNPTEIKRIYTAICSWK